MALAKKRYQVTRQESAFGEETVTVRDTDTGEWVDYDVHRNADMLGNRSTSYTPRYSSRKQRRDMQESGASLGIFIVVVVGACLLLLLVASLYSALPKLVLSAGATALQWGSDIGEMAAAGRIRWGEAVFMMAALLFAIHVNIGRARQKDQRKMETADESIVILFAAAIMVAFCVPVCLAQCLEELGYPAPTVGAFFSAVAKYVSDLRAETSLFTAIMTSVVAPIALLLLLMLTMLPVMLGLAAVLSVPFLLCGRRKNLLLPAWAGAWLGAAALFIGLEQLIPGVIHFLRGIADGAGGLIDSAFGFVSPYGLRSGSEHLSWFARLPGWALAPVGAALLFVCARWLIRHRSK